jgi:hypothetical protein
MLQDYYIAEGSNNGTVKGKEIKLEAKYFFTQDGIRYEWTPSYWYNYCKG